MHDTTHTSTASQEVLPAVKALQYCHAYSSRPGWLGHAYSSKLGGLAMPTAVGWVAWPSGNVLGHINEVALHPARLVLRWVTVHRYVVLVCNQSLRPT